MKGLVQDMKEEYITVLHNDSPISHQKLIIMSITKSEAAGIRYISHIPATELRTALNYSDTSNSLYENLSRMQGSLSLATFLVRTMDGYYIEKPLYRKIDYKNGIFSLEFSKDAKPYIETMKNKIEDYNFYDLFACRNKYTLKTYEIIINEIKINGKYVDDNILSVEMRLDKLRLLLKKNTYKKQKVKLEDNTEIEVLNLEQISNKSNIRNMDLYEKSIREPIREITELLGTELNAEKIYVGKSHKIHGVTITLTKHIEADPRNTLSMEDFFNQVLHVTKNIPIIFTEMKLKKLFQEADYNKDLILESYKQLSANEKYDVQAYEFLLKKVKENRMKEE